MQRLVLLVLLHFSSSVFFFISFPLFFFLAGKRQLESTQWPGPFGASRVVGEGISMNSSFFGTLFCGFQGKPQGKRKSILGCPLRRDIPLWLSKQLIPWSHNFSQLVGNFEGSHQVSHKSQPMVIPCIRDLVVNPPVLSWRKHGMSHEALGRLLGLRGVPRRPGSQRRWPAGVGVCWGCACGGKGRTTLENDLLFL